MYYVSKLDYIDQNFVEITDTTDGVSELVNLDNIDVSKDDVKGITTDGICCVSPIDDKDYYYFGNHISDLCLDDFLCYLPLELYVGKSYKCIGRYAILFYKYNDKIYNSIVECGRTFTNRENHLTGKLLTNEKVFEKVFNRALDWYSNIDIPAVAIGRRDKYDKQFIGNYDVDYKTLLDKCTYKTQLFPMGNLSNGIRNRVVYFNFRSNYAEGKDAKKTLEHLDKISVCGWIVDFGSYSYDLQSEYNEVLKKNLKALKERIPEPLFTLMTIAKKKILEHRKGFMEEDKDREKAYSVNEHFTDYVLKPLFVHNSYTNFNIHSSKNDFFNSYAFKKDFADCCCNKKQDLINFLNDYKNYCKDPNVLGKIQFLLEHLEGILSRLGDESYEDCYYFRMSENGLYCFSPDLQRMRYNIWCDMINPKVKKQVNKFNAKLKLVGKPKVEFVGSDTIVIDNENTTTDLTSIDNIVRVVYNSSSFDINLSNSVRVGRDTLTMLLDVYFGIPSNKDYSNDVTMLSEATNEDTIRKMAYGYFSFPHVGSITEYSKTIREHYLRVLTDSFDKAVEYGYLELGLSTLIGYREDIENSKVFGYNRENSRFGFGNSDWKPDACVRYNKHLKFTTEEATRKYLTIVMEILSKVKIKVLPDWVDFSYTEEKLPHIIYDDKCIEYFEDSVCTFIEDYREYLDIDEMGNLKGLKGV